jgi:hypothetical protein
MFGILKSTIKAASAIIDVPVAVASDLVTLGGMTTDKRGGTYTGDAAGRFVQNVKDIAEPGE